MTYRLRVVTAGEQNDTLYDCYEECMNMFNSISNALAMVFRDEELIAWN